MIAGVEGLASLKWLFRRSKATHLLYQIESHKNGINMVLQIMTLAVQTKALLGRKTDPSESQSDHSNDQDEKAESDLLRQHAENLVHVSYQFLRDAMDGQGKHTESFETDYADEVVPEPDRAQSTQLQLWKEDSEKDNTTRWLYNLVFSSYAESLHGQPTTSRKGSDNDEEAGQPVHTAGAPTNDLPAPNSNPPEHMQLAALIQKPVKASSVVDELLAEWTTLTEDEIAGVVEKGPENSKVEVPPVKFKDAVGRKYSFPYHLFQTWVGAEKLINEAFLHVEIFGPHVKAGHYDILGPTGEIILPSVLEYIIQPGDVLTMQMWPMDKAPQRGPPPQGPKPPPGYVQKPFPYVTKPVWPHADRSKRGQRRGDSPETRDKSR